MVVDRRQLRRVVAEVAPWTTDPDTGPAAVDAGECDRCGDQPRWVVTCGAQPWRQICRDCVLELGTTAFCDGHRDDALAHIATARAMPDDWATITRLAWVARGEVQADDDWATLVADLHGQRSATTLPLASGDAPTPTDPARGGDGHDD